MRSLTGLDRKAAKSAFSELTAKSNLSANQAEFINLIIEYLAESGTIDPKRFYESPFTDLDDQGIAGIFEPSEIRRIVDIVRSINSAAAA